MAEQIPEAWIGQEVTVYYGPGGAITYGHVGGGIGAGCRRAL